MCCTRNVLQSAVRLYLDSCSALSFMLSDYISDSSLETEVAWGGVPDLNALCHPLLFEAFFKARELEQTAVCWCGWSQRTNCEHCKLLAFFCILGL